jgi:hypothetical protein
MEFFRLELEGIYGCFENLEAWNSDFFFLFFNSLLVVFFESFFLTISCFFFFFFFFFSDLQLPFQNNEIGFRNN